MNARFEPLTESQIVDALEKVEAFADSMPCWKVTRRNEQVAIIGNGLYVRTRQKAAPLAPMSIFYQR